MAIKVFLLEISVCLHGGGRMEKPLVCSSSRFRLWSFGLVVTRCELIGSDTGDSVTHFPPDLETLPGRPRVQRQREERKKKKKEKGTVNQI